MARTFLSDCNAGDYLEDVFVITGKQLSTTSTGKPFIKCFIGDRSRQVSARMWNASQPIFNAMPDGGFLRVAGRVENYQDNLQFIIDRFWIIEDASTEVVLDHLLPHTKKDIPQMFEKLSGIVRSVKHPGLKAIVEAYLADEKLMADLRKAPAAMTFHHAYIGGLLEHTLNATEVADAVCAFYPTLSRDLVVVGVFLHDIAKTWELTYGAGFGYSDGGHLVGHVVKSAMWLEDKAREAEKTTPIDRALVDVLQHIILSHHGEPEFGAAKVPATPEAIAVHMIENMDAKLTMSLAATRTEQSGSEGNFTEFQKALGVKLYKPDVAKV
ncbi:MAG: HD domain-containing protein [Tepidisphaeraceae bacterium]